MNFRARRQFAALLVLAIILGAAGLIFWRSFVHEETCTDGRLNQDEEGVDCGGACVSCLVKNRKEPEVRWARATSARAGAYDAVVEVRNPNDRVAARRIDYEFRLMDGAGNIAARQRGRSFLYARELAHFAEFGIRATSTVSRVEFSVLDADWIVSGALRPDIIAAERAYAVEDRDGARMSAVRALLQNRSLRDMADLRVIALALDGNGNMLGANGTEISEMRSDDSLPLIFSWPLVFGAPVESIIIEARPKRFGPGSP